MNTAFGQGNFDLGSNVIGVGIGVGGGYGSGFTYGSQSPAINLQYERGMWSIGGPGIISLGAYVAFKTYKYDYGYSNYNSKWTYSIVGIRSAYHYNGISSDKFDVYGGLMLGMRIVSYTDNEPSFNFDYFCFTSFRVFIITIKTDDWKLRDKIRRLRYEFDEDIEYRFSILVLPESKLDYLQKNNFQFAVNILRDGILI